MVPGGGAAMSGEIGQSGGGSSLKIQRYRSRHLSFLSDGMQLSSDKQRPWYKALVTWEVGS